MPIDLVVPQLTPKRVPKDSEIAAAIQVIEDLSVHIKQMRTLFEMLIGTIEQVASNLSVPSKVTSVSFVESQCFQWVCVECLQRVTMPEIWIHECKCGSGATNPLAGFLFDALNAKQRKIKHVFAPCIGNPEKPCYTEF